MHWTDERVETLLSALEKRIEKLESKLQEEKEETFAIYMFMKAEGREKILVDWINHCYEGDYETAKEMVAPYHDETMDLSTIPCCKEDFEPWGA